MSGSLKKKHVSFTFQSFIRLVIFAIIIFFIISYISNHKLKSDKSKNINQDDLSNSVLGKSTEISNNIYQKIPENSRQQIENLNTNPAVLFIQDKFSYIKEQSKDFPQKQIKEIQKMVAKNIYENTIKNIDNN